MKRSIKRWLATVLALAMVLNLAACGGGKGSSNGANGNTESIETPKTVTLSSENTFAEAEGVKADVGEFVLDDEAELVVKAMPDEEDENGEYKIKSFDISVGDLHELDDFITIRIPYDDSSCDEGEDRTDACRERR